MQQPNYTDNQFVNGALLNQGQSYIAASLKDLGASLFTAGLFYPNDLTYTLNSLSVSVSAGTSFRLLDGEGNLCGFYGTTNGQTSSSVTVDFSSLVPVSGSVTAYLVATRYALSQNSTTVIGPPIGHPDYNPSNAPFLWYTETEDSLHVYATTTAPDNATVFELLRTTLTAGQTSITTYSTANIKYAQPQQSVIPYAGNPNGKVAGVQGGNGISPTIVWDTNDNLLWLCTTTGNASSAVWQGLAPLTGNSNYAFNVANATTSTEAVPLGQAQADFAAINGSASEAFNVDTATAAANAVPLAQLESLINNRTTPYDLFAGFAGVGTDSQIIGNTNIVRSIQFPRNLVWSTAYALTAATDATTYLIYHNSTQVGTLTFAAGATLGVFSCSGFSAVAGDTVSIHGPATADTTLASVTVTILGSTISANSPYDLQFGCGTKPASSQIIGTFVLSETITISSAFAGSICTALTAATSTAVLGITANGSSIGSITFSSGGTDGVFSGAGGTFDAGAVIQVFAPSVQDSTLAGVSGTVFSESTTLQNVYPFMAGLSGAPSAGEAIAAFDFVRPVYFPANMVSSEAIAGVAPTNAVTCTVTLDGTTVATVDFAAGATTGTFATSAAFTATPTQTMKIIAPSSTDSTFADPSFTLWGVTI